MIVLSIAHSKLDPGNTHMGMVEHQVSIKMTNACATMLRAHGVEVEVLPESEERNHLPGKVARINELKPQLAIELHTNSVTDPRPNYGEVIYHPESTEGRLAASCLSAMLRTALGRANHNWPFLGAEPDRRGLYYLVHTTCPAVIVEPLFQSNPDQAQWLGSPDAPETIGAICADGIIAYLKGKLP